MCGFNIKNRFNWGKSDERMQKWNLEYIYVNSRVYCGSRDSFLKEIQYFLFKVKVKTSKCEKFNYWKQTVSDIKKTHKLSFKV